MKGALSNHIKYLFRFGLYGRNGKKPDNVFAVQLFAHEICNVQSGGLVAKLARLTVHCACYQPGVLTQHTMC